MSGEEQAVKMNETVQSNEETKKKPKTKFILNIVLYVFLGILLVFDGFALYSKMNMKGKNGTMNFFGNEVRLVLTGSMNGTDEFYEQHPEFKVKRIRVHDAVYVKTAPAADAKQEKIDKFYSKIVIGDILTFIDQLHGNKIVSHRIVSIKIKVNPETGGNIYKFTMLGDHPDAHDDTPQPAASDGGTIIGKVTGTNRVLGNVLYALVGQKIILVCTVIIPCGVFALIEIIKIIFILSQSRREKVLVANQKKITEKDDELERLRMELERLKSGKNESIEESKEDKQ